MKGEWDWFGSTACKEFLIVRSVDILCSDCEAQYSLADLLADSSWCKAVWGNEIVGETECWCPVCGDHHREERYSLLSATAFRILFKEGKQACIDYITKTMI